MGPPKSPPKMLRTSLPGPIGLAAAELGLLVEVVVGDGVGGAVVLVGGAVKSVGAGLGDEADLRAGGAARVGVGVAGDDAELLDGVLGFAKDAEEGEAAKLVVVVDAVERDVALVGALAVDGATRLSSSPACSGGGI